MQIERYANPDVQRRRNNMDIPYRACLKRGCLFPFTAVVYIPSGCYPKSSSLSHFLSSSLPLLCVSPFPVCLFSSAVRFSELSKSEIQTRICPARMKVHSETSNIKIFPSVQIFVFHSMRNSFLCSFICPPPPSLKSQISDCSHKVCTGNVMQHKQTEFPCILQWLFDAPPFLTKLHPKLCLFTPFFLLKLLSSFSLFLFSEFLIKLSFILIACFPLMSFLIQVELSICVFLH